MKEKQLIARIKELKETYLELPSIDYFYMAVDESGLSENQIRKYLNLFVDKDSYNQDEKEVIIRELIAIS